MSARRLSARWLRHVYSLPLLTLFALGLGLLAVLCEPLQLVRPVVKIGLSAPFGGPYRYVGYDAIYAARLALQEVNAAGGVAGYSVELVAYDDQGTVDGAQEAARNLVQDPEVVAVIGHFRDDTTQSVLEIYRQAGMPLLVAGTVTGEIFGLDGWFCPLLDYLKRGLLHTGGSKIQWIGAGKDLPACAAGWVVKDARLPPPAEIDTVLLTLDPVSAAETVRALREQGWEGRVVGGPALGSDLFTKVAGTASADVVFASSHRWPQSSGEDAGFVAAYRSLGPHVPAPGPFALTTYQTVSILLEAIEQVAVLDGALDRQAISPHLSTPLSETVHIYRWTSRGSREPVNFP